MGKTTLPKPLNTGFSFQWYDKENFTNNKEGYMIPTDVFKRLKKGVLQDIMRIRIYNTEQEAVDDLKQAMT
jgi:hypothetical protein